MFHYGSAPVYKARSIKLQLASDGLQELEVSSPDLNTNKQLWDTFVINWNVNPTPGVLRLTTIMLVTEQTQSQINSPFVWMVLK